MGLRRGDGTRPFGERAEEELFRVAFPGEEEAMRRAARGEGPTDPARETRWEAVLELARRALSAPGAPDEPVRSAADVSARFRYLLAGLPVETLWVLLLDARNRPVRRIRVSVGTLDGSLVHPREVFAPAVASRAAAAVVVHNHPSGDPAPSPQDREATRRLRAAGEILGIPLLDHVIIGGCDFYSFREEGDW